MRWKRSKPSASKVLRPFLFGDVAMDKWPSEEGGGYPWTLFVDARRAWRSGDHEAATRIWTSIAADDSVEARHRLQAWHFLRAAQVLPTNADAARVLAAVAEVSVGRGHDLLVVYVDGTARYLNHSGAATVVEAGSSPPLADAMRSWLITAQQMAYHVGVWDRDELPPLPGGHSRILMLTPGGFRFGQGPDDQLRTDQHAASFLAAATQVLIAITQLE